MRVFLTGAGGMLGGAVSAHAEGLGFEVVAPTRAELEITDAEAVVRAVREARPELVVHCAAYTDVDGAEAEPEEAMRVNGDGTAHVADEAARAGATMLYVSTDYVFDGKKEAPYLPDDEPRPVNAYGRSKLAGEAAVRASGGEWLIVRTSWLYGAGGRNFVDTIARAAREREELRVVVDQRGRPSWTEAVAAALLDLAGSGARGIHHVANRGEATWHDVAVAVVRALGLAVPVLPATAADVQRPAPRPRYSVLDLEETEAALGRRLPPWRESLRDYLREG